MSVPPPAGFWTVCKAPVLLALVGGAIDTIGFIALLGFFTAHVTGNLVLAGAALVTGGAGLWIKLGAIPLFVLTVIATKTLIDHRSSQATHRTLAGLFAAEAAFLLGFMLAGLHYDPFKNPDGAALALTGGLGLVALAIRNTSSKTLMKNISPGTIMTGNTTQMGIDLSNYLRDASPDNRNSLLKSGSVVLGFVLGAFMGALLYVNIGFWGVLPFILGVLYLAHLAFRKQLT